MTKAEFSEILEIYKDQIKSLKDQVQQLREEKLELQKQNFNLQEGLLNIRAPEAYRDMVADRIGYPEVDNTRSRQQMEIQEKYVKSIEDPLFKSPDDMILMLSSALNDGKPLEPKSTHNNSES